MAGLPSETFTLHLEGRPGTLSIDPLLTYATATGLFGVSFMPYSGRLPLTTAAMNLVDPVFR